VPTLAAHGTKTRFRIMAADAGVNAALAVLEQGTPVPGKGNDRELSARRAASKPHQRVFDHSLATQFAARGALTENRPLRALRDFPWSTASFGAFVIERFSPFAGPGALR
jgi:hypothetical protein